MLERLQEEEEPREREAKSFCLLFYAERKAKFLPKTIYVNH